MNVSVVTAIEAGIPQQINALPPTLIPVQPRGFDIFLFARCLVIKSYVDEINWAICREVKAYPGRSPKLAAIAVLVALMDASG